MSSPIARVVPELSLDRAFDYFIPEAMRAEVVLGSKVRVPFGARAITGYVVELRQTSEFEKLKAVEAVIGTGAFIPPTLIELAQWMSLYYCSPLGAALQTVLPQAVRGGATHFKERLWVQPLGGVEPDFGRAKSQKLAWEHVKGMGGAWLHELIAQTGITPAVWRGLAQKNLVSISAERQERDPHSAQTGTSTQPLLFNAEQKVAFDALMEEWAKPKPQAILLLGVTGSGKTEVYLQGIDRVLDAGQSALVLVPEIALTPQTVERFRRRFQGRKAGIAVLHSHLSQGERHDQWHQIREGRAQIVIGARSAVFAPLVNLGLIVVDEEHENSYKQEESPHYHARDVAVMRGHLESIPVLLGSATPSLESFLNARDKKYRLCTLRHRVEVQQLPTTHVLDLRQEFKKAKTVSLIAPSLAEAVDKRLGKHEQTIIFLNRRGYATSLQCPQCGHVEECPRCSVPLTYHRNGGKLRCHLCDYVAEPPTRCPECQFDSYRQRGAGTEKIEEVLESTFPTARIVRMDSDTMRNKNSYQETLGAFARGEIDILVGTQMIAKGLHFPNVTCVGVVNADSALQLPDFRSSERVFQLLMQVSGRSGRGDVHGEVYVQTRTPFHPAVQFARHHDYDGFADQELEFRKALNYPPYQRAILITWRGRSEEKTSYVADQTTKRIVELAGPEVLVTGPAPAPIAKINEQYRFHLFLRAARLLPVTRALRPLLLDAQWPDDIKVTVDVDPMNLL
jgi:primosomal protein N' (replication factor Y) (superfamily II helicase)